MTVFSKTYDIATPAGSDSPTEADDRMRETKAAVQERLAVEHRFALTGTEVSAADTGEHTDITTDSIVNAGTMTNAGTLDVAGDLAVNTNKFKVTAASGNTLVAGTLDVAGAAEVTGVATLGDASLLKTSAAPSTDAMIANKKYVDDQLDAVARFGVWNDRDADGSGDSVVKDTQYTAATDGFVIANIVATGSAALVIDLQSPTGTTRAKVKHAIASGVTTGDQRSATIPVKKGDTWKVVTTGSGAASTTTVFWMPFGTD